MLKETGATESGCRNTGVHHVGLHAKNPTVAAEFYRDVLEMHIVGGSESDHPLGASAFLCSRPDQESHDIALFENPIFAHVAFKVSSLAELRSVHARVLREEHSDQVCFQPWRVVRVLFRGSRRQLDRGLLAYRRTELAPAEGRRARSVSTGRRVASTCGPHGLNFVLAIRLASKSSSVSKSWMTALTGTWAGSPLSAAWLARSRLLGSRGSGGFRR